MTAQEQAEWLSGSIGSYNATDLNRVESAVQFLSESLANLPQTIRTYAESLGVAWDAFYDVPYDPNGYTVTTKTDWAIPDIPNETSMTRYLNNVVLLRSALTFDTDTLPAEMSGLSTAEANAIEQVLLDLNTAIQELLDLKETYIRNASLAWFYSGEIYAGEV